MLQMLPRKLVKPAPAVVQVPERHADDHIRMAVERFEQPAVIFGLLAEPHRRTPGCVRVGGG
jgi:hypothetical protein